MTASTIRKLAECEYDFVAIDTRVADLLGLLEDCAADAPACRVAARTLADARWLLRQALGDVDGPLTEAVRLHEALEPAPF